MGFVGGVGSEATDMEDGGSNGVVMGVFEKVVIDGVYG